MASKLTKRQKIKLRIRNKIKGKPNLPRLSVFRSNKQIYAQIIDDINGVTIAAASSKDVTSEGSAGNVDTAKKVGQLIAERAKGSSIENVVFDRSGYIYHGRVKSLAEGAREGGLKF